MKITLTRFAAVAHLRGGLWSPAAATTRRHRRRRRHRTRPEDHRREGHRPELDGRRQGQRHVLHRQGHLGRRSRRGIKAFNKANPEINVKLLEFPESADEQRNQFVQRQEAKSADCDVFHSDVIWTAEFASQKWLYDMTPYVEPRKDEFIPSTLDDRTYEGKTWGVPHKYRTRASSTTAPTRSTRRRRPGRTSTQAATKTAASSTRAPPYEGLTVRLPRAGVRGGRQGPVRRRQEGDDRLAREPEGAEVHGRRHQGRRRAEGRHDLHGGGAARRRSRPASATFMRNWPYAYALGQKAPKRQGQVRGRAAARRSRAAARPASSAAPTSSSPPTRRTRAARSSSSTTWPTRSASPRTSSKFSDASPLKSIYDDPAVKKAQPFSDELKPAIEQAKSRPVSPVYPQISAGDVQERQPGALRRDESRRTRSRRRRPTSSRR